MRSGSGNKAAPYEQLRRHPRELRHRDGEGLRDLMDDYFALADEVELPGRVTDPGPPPSTHSSRAA